MTKQVLTILVVDDQPEIRRALTDWLMRAGHVPITARSGSEAGTMLRGMHVDALVTDLVMPHGNGLELIMDARAAFPGLRIVAISSVEQSDAATAAGADSCLRKPLNADSLLRAIAA
jgi:CheY-like chemotaxis protein